MLKRIAIAALAAAVVVTAANAGKRIGRGSPEHPIIPTTDFTLSDYLGASSNNGPYTYILDNTHISGSCAGTNGATCAVDKAQLMTDGNWPGVNGGDRIIQTAQGGWFKGHIDNGPTTQAAGPILKLTSAVTGTALANGQQLYTGPLPGTTITAGSGNSWTISGAAQRFGTTANPVMLTNGKGTCFNGMVDDGAGNAGNTLTVLTSQQDCLVTNGTKVALAIGQGLFGGDNDITFGGGFENQGAFRFICVSSHINYDDPVVAPGVKGGSKHLHNFYGNTLTDFSSTYESLRTKGGGTCSGGPINRTGYWFPALIDPNGNGGAGAVVQPDYIELYYKGDRVAQTKKYVPGSFRQTNPFIQLPRGLRYITGYNMTLNAPDGFFFWECPDDSVETAAPGYTAPSDLPTLWGYLQAVGKTTTACKRIAVRLEAHVCWSGKLDSTPDHMAHVTTSAQDGFGNNICPNDHIQVIPALTFIVTFNRNTEDFSQWYLSSDCAPGANLATCRADGNLVHTAGSSFHHDWFGAWDYSVMDKWQTHCLQIGSRVFDPTYVAKPTDTQNSSAGVNCDGTSLSTAGGTTPSGYVSPPITTAVSTWPSMYLPIPPRP